MIIIKCHAKNVHLSTLYQCEDCKFTSHKLKDIIDCENEHIHQYHVEEASMGLL